MDEGKSLPKITPASMQSTTHQERYRSKNPNPLDVDWGVAVTVCAIVPPMSSNLAHSRQPWVLYSG